MSSPIFVSSALSAAIFAWQARAFSAAAFWAIS